MHGPLGVPWRLNTVPSGLCGRAGAHVRVSAAASFIPHGLRLPLRLIRGLWGRHLLLPLTFTPSLGRMGGAADKDGPGQTLHRGLPATGRAGEVHGDLQGPEGNGEQLGLQPPPGAGTCGALRPPGSQGTLSPLPGEASTCDRCHLCRTLANSSSVATLETLPRTLGKFCFQWSQLSADYRQGISQADTPTYWALQNENIPPELRLCSSGES